MNNAHRGFMQLLRDAARLFHREFKPLAVITLITLGPISLVSTAWSVLGDRNNVVMEAVFMILPALFGLFQMGGVIAWLGSSGTKQKRSVGSALKRGLYAWFDLLVLNLDIGVRVLMGLICFIIPGIRTMVRYALAGIVLILEGKVARQARERSACLVGSAWLFILVAGGCISLLFEGLGLFISSIPQFLDYPVWWAVITDLISQIPVLYATVWFFLLYQDRVAGKTTQMKSGNSKKRS